MQHNITKQNHEVHGRFGVWQRIEAIRYKMEVILFSFKYPGVNILLTEITVEIECIRFFALRSGKGIQKDEELRYVIKCITPNKFSPFHPLGMFIFIFDPLIIFCVFPAL